MQGWENALAKFMESWKEEVIGFLVCGSYVTGNPSRRSDIDLHIITAEGTDWRSRGSNFVNGYHIEYFVNPPEQIRAYFRSDHRTNSIDSPTQFVTGRIILDETGAVAQLKKDAQDILKEKFKGLDETSLVVNKYLVWDALDNLGAAHEKKSKSFNYQYYYTLRKVLEFYSRYLRWEVYSPAHVYELMTDPEAQKKYLQTEYPDPVFRDKFVEAMTVTCEQEMMMCIEGLVDYVFEQTGGFKIDGWSVKSPLDMN